MGSVVVSIPVDLITDWPSFHDVFKQALGFPDFYGRNMNAWIDCLTYLNDGMTTVLSHLGNCLF
jgi:RNAse (barnase) inhibitor barstar